MKKNIINFSISFFIFIFFIALVELFFNANAKYDWIKPKQFVVSVNNFTPDLTHVPKSIIKDVENKYKNYQINNIEFQHRQIELKFNSIRKFETYAVSSFFKNFLIYPWQSLIIQDEYSNPLLNKAIFKAKYSLDENGFRIIPKQVFSKDRKNILLIGCSFTFGIGVNDDQNIAYFLKQKMSEYNIYNLGNPSGGMSDMLDDIYINKRIKNINKNGGAVVYIFHYDHLERTFCSLDCYRSSRIKWQSTKNYYDFDSQGELVNYGPRKEFRPIQYQFLKAIAQSKFLSFIGYDMPRVYDSDEELTYIKFIKKLKEHYLQYGLEFILYLHQESSIAVSSEFFDNLKKNNIKFFVTGNSSSFLINTNDRIIGDGHYSEVGNYYRAGVIHNFLKKRGY